MKQDQEAKNVILNAKSNCREETQHYYEMHEKETNQNSGWLAQALLKVQKKNERIVEGIAGY